MSDHKKLIERFNLNISHLALTASPAHGQREKFLKSISSPAIKGEIFEDESQEEIDVINDFNQNNLESAELGLQVATIAEDLETDSLTAKDAAVKLRELSEHIDDNISGEGEGENKENQEGETITMEDAITELFN